MLRYGYSFMPVIFYSCPFERSTYVALYIYIHHFPGRISAVSVYPLLAAGIRAAVPL